MKQRFRRPLILIHRVTLLLGGLLLAWPLFVAVDSAYAQWSGKRELAAQEQGGSQETILPGHTAAHATRGKPLANFRMPRLNLSYVLLEGADAGTLDKSIGHVEGTGDIGKPGNIAIAGHRNTHFRKLEWVRRGDEIILEKAGAEYRYRVEWIRLFQPGDLQVLDPRHGPAVTLITCFPFEYVGSAPLRMIVRALPDDSTRKRVMQ